MLPPCAHVRVKASFSFPLDGIPADAAALSLLAPGQPPRVRRLCGHARAVFGRDVGHPGPDAGCPTGSTSAANSEPSSLPHGHKGLPVSEPDAEPRHHTGGQSVLQTVVLSLKALINGPAQAGGSGGNSCSCSVTPPARWSAAQCIRRRARRKGSCSGRRARVARWSECWKRHAACPLGEWSLTAPRVDDHLVVTLPAGPH
jgi:hypothetical protein